MRGCIARYDLMTTAPAEAASFYERVLGWTTQIGPGAQDLFVGAGGPFGGVMGLVESTHPHWLCHITVEDLTMALEMTKALGGQPLGAPVTVPETGRYCRVQGPGGSIIGLFEKATAPATGESDAIRAAAAWNECASNHFEDDWAFLTGLFGWLDRGTMTHPDGRQYRMFGRSHEVGDGTGGFSTRPADLSRACWVVYFSVADLTPALATVTEQGGGVTSTPMQLPNGDWVVRCRDPQGAVFALFSQQRS